MSAHILHRMKLFPQTNRFIRGVIEKSRALRVFFLIHCAQ